MIILLAVLEHKLYQAEMITIISLAIKAIIFQPEMLYMLELAIIRFKAMQAMKILKMKAEIIYYLVDLDIILLLGVIILGLPPPPPAQISNSNNDISY